jgi:hypothetical protein
MYFPRNWEFGSALIKLLNFGGGGFEPPPSLGTPLLRSKAEIYLMEYRTPHTGGSYTSQSFHGNPSQ